MKILAIDPGPEQSAYVLWDGTDDVIIEKGYQSNNEIGYLLTENVEFSGAQLFIEMIGHYGTGMPAGKTVFDTCIWIGRFIECWSGRPYELILRPTIKAHLCGSARAKDANVSRALKDRLGEPGTKKQPGRTFGITSHCWAALAVAVTAHDRLACGL